MVASGPRSQGPGAGPDSRQRRDWNHEALSSSWRGRDRYTPPLPAETRFDPQGQGASQPMLPARSVPALGPQQRWSHGFIFAVSPSLLLGAGLSAWSRLGRESFLRNHCSGDLKRDRREGKGNNESGPFEEPSGKGARGEGEHRKGARGAQKSPF